MTARPWILAPREIGSILIALLLGAICALPVLAQNVRIMGTVRDSSGAVISGAQIEIHSATFASSTTSSTGGEFSFEHVVATSGTITVNAPGMKIVEQNWRAGADGLVRLEITVEPLPSSSSVVVTAARTATPLSDSPISVTQLSSRDLEATPALTLDDALRQVPGFSLFRRTSSRVANPTTQGVSLRGLGANGASRALVLEDGVPLNDPFGAWVYWDRVPDASVQEVEVAQEGASSLYGSEALGGVVQFLTRSPEQGGVTLETSYGNQNTPDLSLWAGGMHGKWEAAFGGSVFHTDGYVLVPGANRGSVDIDAGSQHGTADLMIGRKIWNDSEVFARGWFLSESRGNGTPDQINDTKLGEGALGANLQLGSFGSLTLRFYGDTQTYHQTFSSVATDRNSETLTDIQTVPAQGVGGSAIWSRSLGKRQTLVAGYDEHEEIGGSNEALLSASKDQATGGRQRALGIFGEDIVQITPRWTLAASARVDDWRNFDASLYSAPISTPTVGTMTAYPNISYNAFSPRLSVVNRVTSHVSWSASIYRAFRAPTLNELYRSFRQGNVITESNPNLTAEHLTGGEAGVAVEGWNRRLQVRTTTFVNEIIDPVANVTCTPPPVSTCVPNSNPSLINRQRQNLGRIRAPGVEVDAIVQVASHFQLSTGYQYVDATVTRNPINPALVGNWVAQVPQNVLTFQARYENPSRINFSIDGRMVGNQFDDDQNQFPLGRFFVLDAMTWRGIGHGVELFFAGENLLNEKYDIAATPVPELGLPIAVRVGLRIDIPKR